jgi:cytochrome c biogenesis protein CcmG, thiol:disulfide interchange protein DsbE
MTNPTDQRNSSAQFQPRNLVALVILAVGVAGVLFWNFYWRPKTIASQTGKSSAIGKELPVLELQPLTGSTSAEPISLDKVRDKVVLINYWGTWCPPCRQEFPHIVELWDRYRGNADFELLSVSSSGRAPEDVEDVRGETEKYLKANSVTMPTYIDARGVSRQAVAELIGKDGFGYPTTILLDRKGVVRAVWSGYSPGVERSMANSISKLLANK